MEHPWIHTLMLFQEPFVPMYRASAQFAVHRTSHSQATTKWGHDRPCFGTEAHDQGGKSFYFTLVGQPQAQYGVRSTQETVSWQCVACGRPTHRLANGHEPLIPDTWGMDTVQSLFVSSIQDMPTAPERDIHQASEVSSSWTEVPDPPSRSTLLQLQTSAPSGNLHLGTYGHSRHSARRKGALPV